MGWGWGEQTEFSAALLFCALGERDVFRAARLGAAGLKPPECIFLVFARCCSLFVSRCCYVCVYLSFLLFVLELFLLIVCLYLSWPLSRSLIASRAVANFVACLVLDFDPLLRVDLRTRTGRL